MPKKHVVAEGDCIESIAYRNGFFPETVWKHELNAALRAARSDPHTLSPGDVVTIPDLNPGSVDAAAGRVHTFRRRGVPAKVRLVLDNDGEPRADVAYKLTVGDRVYEATTGADGAIDQWIDPDAREAVLTIGSAESYVIALGQLRPSGFELGTAARLRNLGYLTPASEEDERAVALALFEFQVDQKLTATGLPDDDTLARLLQEHGN